MRRKDGVTWLTHVLSLVIPMAIHENMMGIAASMAEEHTNQTKNSPSIGQKTVKSNYTNPNTPIKLHQSQYTKNSTKWPRLSIGAPNVHSHARISDDDRNIWTAYFAIDGSMVCNGPTGYEISRR